LKKKYVFVNLWDEQSPAKDREGTREKPESGTSDEFPMIANRQKSPIARVFFYSLYFRNDSDVKRLRE
jgi:hypothetical protein